jgi:hypothetical protein
MGEKYRELHNLPIQHDEEGRKSSIISGGKKEKFHISKSEGGILSGNIK